MKKLLTYFVVLVVLISCKKKDELVKEEPLDPNAPVNVLKENSGFDTVFNVVRGLGSVNGAPPAIKIADFTVETNNNFNIVYYTEEQLQQSLTYGYVRYSKNLTTNATVPLPQYADDLRGLSPAQLKLDGLGLGLQQFKPYSNFFIYAVVRNSSSLTFANSISFEGDFDSKIKSFNPVGEPDMGFYLPSSNNGIRGNSAYCYYTIGVIQSDTEQNYLTSVCNPYLLLFTNNSGSPLLKCLLESRYGKVGNLTAFTIRPDSLIASEIDRTTTAMTTVNRLKLGESNLLKSTNYYSTIRHYSTDGKIMGILLKNEDEKKYWTYSYNFTTKVLSKGQEGVTLDYSADGSDIDLDEFGNIYYSGYAANGTNKVGVSIYKKGIDGQTTRIGADDFLKFGTIIKLKFLMGKVYFALNGKKTGLDKYQLSVLRQQ